MPRYIDADLILPEMESKFDMQELYLPVHFQEFIVGEIPTADVAPVVRCKDCKYLEISGCYGECGKGYLGIVRPDCYCCYGERRIDDV